MPGLIRTMPNWITSESTTRQLTDHKCCQFVPETEAQEGTEYRIGARFLGSLYSSVASSDSFYLYSCSDLLIAAHGDHESLFGANECSVAAVTFPSLKRQA